jgi:hypothetical protein
VNSGARAAAQAAEVAAVDQGLSHLSGLRSPFPCTAPAPPPSSRAYAIAARATGAVQSSSSLNLRSTVVCLTSHYDAAHQLTIAANPVPSAQQPSRDGRPISARPGNGPCSDVEPSAFGSLPGQVRLRAFQDGEGARGGGRRQRLRSVYFPPRPQRGGRFASRNKINGPPPSSAALRPCGLAPAAVQPPPPGLWQSPAIKAAKGGPQPQRRHCHDASSSRP